MGLVAAENRRIAPWLPSQLLELLSVTAQHLSCFTAVKYEPRTLCALINSANAVGHGHFQLYQDVLMAPV